SGNRVARGRGTSQNQSDRGAKQLGEDHLPRRPLPPRRRERSALCNRTRSVAWSEVRRGPPGPGLAVAIPQHDPKASPEISGHWAQELRERVLTIQALDVSSYTGLFELPNGGGTGVAAVSPEFLFGGVRLGTSDSGGNVITMEAMSDPKSGSVTLSGARKSDVVRSTLLGARSYPDQARDAQTFSSLRKIKGDLDILEALKIIEPRTRRIEVLSEITGPSIYLDIGLQALVPLAVCGEGLVRLFSITVELAALKEGVLLIDEIDNGLHYSVMPHLWQLLGQLVEKHNVQIFATTHNHEILRTALEAFRGLPGVLGLFRIDKRGDRYVMVGYDDEAMEAVLEVRFEVRG